MFGPNTSQRLLNACVVGAGTTVATIVHMMGWSVLNVTLIYRSGLIYHPPLRSCEPPAAPPAPSPSSSLPAPPSSSAPPASYAA